MAKLKLASINIWGSFANPTKRIQHAIEFINHKNLDVVCFQELTREKGLETKYIQEKTGLAHCFLMQSPNDSGIYEGCAILSRLPLQSTAAFRLPDSHPARFLLETRLEKTDFQIFATHLSYQTKENLPQIKEMLQLAQSSSRAVLVGDFNLDLKPMIKTFGDYGFQLNSSLENTWPVDKQMFKKAWEEKLQQPLHFEPQAQTLDGIFSKGVKATTQTFLPHSNGCLFSDHKVIIADIEF